MTTRYHLYSITKKCDGTATKQLVKSRLLKHLVPLMIVANHKSDTMYFSFSEHDAEDRIYYDQDAKEISLEEWLTLAYILELDSHPVLEQTKHLNN